MFGFLLSREEAKKTIAMLHDFEMSCLGEKPLSPDDFVMLNKELSLSAVNFIGECHFERKEDGHHVIWTAPDKSSHDLGVLTEINVMKDYPGFHKARSLCLGHKDVIENEVLSIGHSRKHVSMVKLKDGTEGYGPNYKIALRNAALKSRLQKQFLRVNPLDLWKKFYGNA